MNGVYIKLEIMSYRGFRKRGFAHGSGGGQLLAGNNNGRDPGKETTKHKKANQGMPGSQKGGGTVTAAAAAAAWQGSNPKHPSRTRQSINIYFSLHSSMI